MAEQHWQTCVGVALEYPCDLAVRSEEAGRFWSVTGFDTNYLCESGMFLLQWSQLFVSLFLLALLKVSTKLIRVKNNSTDVSITLSK